VRSTFQQEGKIEPVLCVRVSFKGQLP